MHAGSHPWDDGWWDQGISELQLVRNMVKRLEAANSIYDTKSAEGFALRMLQLDPAKRPSARELLDDVYFSDIL